MHRIRQQLFYGFWLTALLGLPATSSGAPLPAAAPAQRPPANRLYGAIGLGFINIDRGVGVNIPFGITAVLSRYRLISTVNPLDLGLLEGQNRNLRYYRPYLGSTWCVDSKTGQYVPDYYCSGGTDALLSASADLSYILLEELWISDQPGKLFVGLGRRLVKPQTFYGTIGFHFVTHTQRAGGFKLAMGKEYVNVGIFWGIDLLHPFRRRTNRADRRWGGD